MNRLNPKLFMQQLLGMNSFDKHCVRLEADDAAEDGT